MKKIKAGAGVVKYSPWARLNPQGYFIHALLPLRTSNNSHLWVDTDSPLTHLLLRALPVPVPTSCREVGEASVNLASKVPSGKYPTELDDSVLPATEPGLATLTHGVAGSSSREEVYKGCH